MSDSKSFLIRARKWVEGQFVQDVPEDIELCEFDCSKGQCTVGEWESCERRRRRAAGELLPAEGDACVEGRINENPSMVNSTNDSLRS